MNFVVNFPRLIFKTFMNKYQFIFNTEMKTVGFYLNNKKIEKKIR